MHLAGAWHIDVVVRRKGLEDTVARFRWRVAPPGEPRPYAVFERAEQALLLMHQPPDWLSDRGREIFDAEVDGWW